MARFLADRSMAGRFSGRGDDLLSAIVRPMIAKSDLEASITAGQGHISWWPGAGSNRRPIDFQGNGRSLCLLSLTCEGAWRISRIGRPWERIGNESCLIQA
jgi:hypothetical protein